jgi:uncharacterized protein YcbX
MYLKEIWRYPVKSMAGQQLQSAELGPLGIAGDRVVQVRDGKRGRMITARTHPRLLGHRSTMNVETGELLIDGQAWDSPDILEKVRKIAGPNAELVRDESARRFDILPLLVATDGTIEAFGRDGRRLRPNLVIGGVPGLAERQWPGRRLRIGDVLIDPDSLRGRCIMTTYDPDTLEQDTSVLRDIIQRFDGELALNAAVASGGRIEVGQSVELLG